MKKIKICLIPYLNAAILQYDFIFSRNDEKFVKSIDFPCNCAEKIRKGESDLALIPSIEYQKIDDVKIISDLAIASIGKVESVILVTKEKKLDRIKKIGITSQSKTSVALLKILCYERYKINPEFEVFESLKEAYLKYDAFLVIGDAALTENFSSFEIIDLAYEWYLWQKLSFVFAFWVIREKFFSEKIEEILLKSYENGTKNMEKIITNYSDRLKIDIRRIHNYLTNSLYFKMGEMEKKSLRLFYTLCKKNGIIEEIRNEI